MQSETFKGGQGRSSSDVVEAGTACAVIAVAGLAVLAVIVLRGLGAW